MLPDQCQEAALFAYLFALRADLLAWLNLDMDCRTRLAQLWLSQRQACSERWVWFCWTSSPIQHMLLDCMESRALYTLKSALQGQWLSLASLTCEHTGQQGANAVVLSADAWLCATRPGSRGQCQRTVAGCLGKAVHRQLEGRGPGEHNSACPSGMLCTRHHKALAVEHTSRQPPANWTTLTTLHPCSSTR